MESGGWRKKCMTIRIMIVEASLIAKNEKNVCQKKSDYACVNHFDIQNLYGNHFYKMKYS